MMVAAVSMHTPNRLHLDKGINYTLTTTCNPTRVTNKIKGKLYPTKIQLINRRPPNTTVGFAGVCTKKFGYPEDYVVGSYLYFDETVEIKPGTVDKDPVSYTVRIEARVEKDPTRTGKRKGWNRYRLSKVELQSYTAPDDYDFRKGITSDIKISVGNGFRFHADSNKYPNNSTAGFKIRVEQIRRSEETIEYSFKSVYRTSVELTNGGTNVNKNESFNTTMQGKTYRIKVEETFVYTYQSENSVTYTTPADTTGGPVDVGTITTELTSLSITYLSIQLRLLVTLLLSPAQTIGTTTL